MLYSKREGVIVVERARRSSVASKRTMWLLAGMLVFYLCIFVPSAYMAAHPMVSYRINMAWGIQAGGALAGIIATLWALYLTYGDPVRSEEDGRLRFWCLRQAYRLKWLVGPMNASLRGVSVFPLIALIALDCAALSLCLY